MAIHTGQEPLRDYDAHVYFRADQRARADALRARIEQAFAGTDIRVAGIFDRPVGPHPMPNFELNFSRAMFDRVLLWLVHHRDDHTVLVHPVTGDDPVDHLQNGIWLGAPVPLDASRLDPSPNSPVASSPGLCDESGR